jgi:hypothetical protein
LAKDSNSTSSSSSEEDNDYLNDEDLEAEDYEFNKES